MTLLAERPATIESTRERITDMGVVDVEPRGSYVTLPAGVAQAGTEGTYVTIGDSRKPSRAGRGSYVTVTNAPIVANRPVEGSYVTLSTAA